MPRRFHFADPPGRTRSIGLPLCLVIALVLGITRPIPLAVAATVQVSLGVTNVYVLNSATSILIYLVVGLALFFWVQIALRTMLLAHTAQSQRGLR